MLYDYQAKPENIDLMTFVPNGSNRRVNRSWQMPRATTAMVQRRKAMQAWAALSYGFMGGSPITLPPRWSASAWASKSSRTRNRAR